MKKLEDDLGIRVASLEACDERRVIRAYATAWHVDDEKLEAEGKADQGPQFAQGGSGGVEAETEIDDVLERAIQLADTMRRPLA